MIIWIAPVLGFLRSALPYALLFLRGVSDLLAPKPATVSAPYTPPYTGGQCVGIGYWLSIYVITDDGGGYQHGSRFEVTGPLPNLTPVIDKRGSPYVDRIFINPLANIIFVEGTGRGASSVIIQLTRRDGLEDTCGNPPNPIPPPAIPDDGLFNPTNPKIGDNNGTLNPAAIILSPALPLVLVGAIAAGYAAAMAAAKTATDILAGIQKLGEGFEFLKDLFKKLAEDLDEKEKLKPKNRDIVRQTYGQLKGDGAIDFFPDNNTKFEPIQLDIIIVAIPIGFGKYFGSFSPHRYRYKELGYISFYSVNQGILETHSIQFKRTTLQIPPLAIGFIYHFGLDEQIRGFAFGTFSVEKT